MSMAENIKNINEKNSEEYDRGYEEAIKAIKEQLEKSSQQGGGNSGGQQGSQQPDPRLIMPINSQNGNGENQKENQDQQRQGMPNNRTMDVGNKNEVNDSYNNEHGTGNTENTDGKDGKDDKDGKDGKDGKNSKDGKNGDKGKGNEQEGEPNPDSFSGGEMDHEQDIDDIEGSEWDGNAGMTKLAETYSGKISGVIGQYVTKCDEAIEDIKKIKEKKDKIGMTSYARRANSAPWDVQVKHIIDKYIGTRVRKSNHKEKTYRRPNRRNGVVEFGEPLKKGTQTKKDKMFITMTFYIDISGSMSGEPVKNAFNSAYKFSDFIIKKYKGNAKVSDCLFDYYAFNTRFSKVKAGTIPHANGDNVDFNEILEEINKKSLNDLVNIIITDAQFPIPLTQTVNAVKNSNGMYIVITNSDYSRHDLEAVQNKIPDKFVWIQADSKFSISPDLEEK